MGPVEVSEIPPIQLENQEPLSCLSSLVDIELSFCLNEVSCFERFCDYGHVMECII